MHERPGRHESMAVTKGRRGVSGYLGRLTASGVARAPRAAAATRIVECIPQA